MELTREELEEIKRAINTIIAERIKHDLVENSEIRKKDNKRYLDLDYKILEKVLKEIDTYE